ncbi:MAG: hypothetical protein ACRDK7_12015 [Solirubrobacteraceae bacterium]
MVRRLRWTIAGAATIGVLCIPSAAGARGVTGSPRARAAHALKAADTAHLRYVRSAGSLLLDEGTASGTLPGRMRASVNVGATIRGTFTMYIHGGKVTGHGSATPHGSGRYESFAGTLVVTGGSGRYKHARGSARLYGTFDRDNYALVVQTAGTLHY